MQTFKQSSLYYAFLEGDASRTNLDNNELCLCRTSWFGDLVQIVAIVAKYSSNFGLFAKISHLEGEEVFGLAKHKANLPPRLEVNSHRHDQVNFFRPKVANVTTLIN